jgi:hypothetical protein
MTKFISLVIIALVALGGWKFYQYCQQFNTDKQQTQQQDATASQISGDQLPGMPGTLTDSYNAVVQQGPDAVKAWLDRYAAQVKDPRLAWIQLDYMVSIAHAQPGEARRIFAEVNARVPDDSPVHFRLKRLEATYK